MLSSNIEIKLPRRIHIIGGPGSGKTTLARQLGLHLGAPVYDLDQIAFEGLDFVKRPLEARKADVNRIAAQPVWITEGIFLGWIDELLRAADIIVWLDCLSWRVAIWRIVVRFVRAGLSEAKRRPGLHKFTHFQDYARNLRLLIGVFFASRQYYHGRSVDPQQNLSTENRTATSYYLAPYQQKVVHCRSANEIQDFMSQVLTMRGKPELRATA